MLKKYNFTDILEGLGSRTIQKLRNYLIKNGGRNDSALVRLADRMLSDHPKYKKRGDNFETLISYYLKEEPLKSSSLKKLRSRLTQKTEDFLILEYFKEYASETERDAILLKMYQRLKNTTRTHYKIEKLDSHLPINELAKDEDTLLKHQGNHHFWTQEKDPKRFYQSARLLDCYYLSIRLQYLSEWQSCKNVVNLSNSPFHSSPITIDSATIQSGNYSVKLKILVSLNQLYEQGSEPEEVQAFQQQYFDSEKLLMLDKPFARDLYLHLRNIYIGFINKGAKQYVKNAFELQKRAEAAAVLFFDQALREVDWWVIVTIGYSRRQTHWTNRFIDKHLDKLSPAERKFAKEFTEALQKFYAENYTACIRLLEGMESKAFDDNMNTQGKYPPVFTKKDTIRIYLMKIRACYEGGRDFKIKLEQTCQYFRKDLERIENFSEKRLNNYLDFISIVEVLNKLRYKNIKTKTNKIKLNELEKDIKNYGGTYKVWLEEKFMSIIK